MPTKSCFRTFSAIILLCFFSSGNALADTLSQTFELLAPPNIRDPFVLDIPFHVTETGMIHAHVTFEGSSSNNVKQMMAVLMQDVSKGQRVRVIVKRQQSNQIRFAVDSMNLKQTRKFFIRLINADPHGSIRGRLSVSYPGRRSELPDLVVTNTRTDSYCHLIVTITNKGKGMLDLSAWEKNSGIDVAIERNNRFWGAAGLQVIDPIQRLVHPGGFAHYKTNLKAPVQGAENIALVIDRKNRIRESNKQNNRQNYSMSCALPDLTITRVYLNDSCQVSAELKNTGNAKLLPDAYDLKGPTVMIKRNGRTWGGQALILVDPQRKLRQPGATVTFTSQLRIGQQPEKIQVLIDQENKVREKNDKNNFRNAELRCESKRPHINIKPATPMRLNIQ